MYEYLKNQRVKVLCGLLWKEDVYNEPAHPHWHTVKGWPQSMFSDEGIRPFWKVRDRVEFNWNRCTLRGHISCPTPDMEKDEEIVMCRGLKAYILKRTELKWLNQEETEMSFKRGDTVKTLDGLIGKLEVYNANESPPWRVRFPDGTYEWHNGGNLSPVETKMKFNIGDVVRVSKNGDVGKIVRINPVGTTAIKIEWPNGDTIWYSIGQVEKVDPDSKFPIHLEIPDEDSLRALYTKMAFNMKIYNKRLKLSGLSETDYSCSILNYEGRMIKVGMDAGIDLSSPKEPIQEPIIIQGETLEITEDGGIKCGNYKGDKAEVRRIIHLRELSKIQSITIETQSDKKRIRMGSEGWLDICCGGTVPISFSTIKEIIKRWKAVVGEEG